MIVLTGFMGAGKSTAARELAAEAGVAALDADDLLAERLGAPVEEVFATRGEEEFRRREEELVLELLGRGEGVLALGGGAVESARVRAALRDHLVVLLDVDAGTAWERVRRSARPLARDRAAFDALLARRRPLYDEVARWVVPGRQGAALRAYRCLRDAAGLRAIWAATAGGEYPVVLGAGARAAPLRGDDPTEAFVLTDANVAPLWAPGADFVMPAGERHKTLEVAERVWRAMARAGVTRGGELRAVGGGVVTDLGGFCAATYQRGIAVVHVPTTLLAMVDAAIGGKTGVDLPEAKNYVGAYHQPRAVLADTETLATLPPAQVAEGYAEVVKTALIAGGRLWERVAGGEPAGEETIFACARTKVAVVAADERDGGVRQALNLGHTVGHALETVSGYALTHGQAVGLGLLAALRLSGQDTLRGQVAGLLAGHGLPTAAEGVDVDAVVEATRRDKKRVGARVPFVLVAAPGDVRHGQAVGDRELRAAVAELRA
ncbi:MAG TPA: bifunctional shikimate kinase/3-dehydroquinate synthase [Solirubrobacteraceae bacterium]|nr:bifunctional shikimate kinase/3-dehydroquinate synthase [Solirubrobacteraceae bacterium]